MGHDLGVESSVMPTWVAVREISDKSVRAHAAAPQRQPRGNDVLRQYLERGLCSASELARIAMVQPTDTRNCNDLPHFSRLDRPLFWCVHCEAQMRSIFVAIVNVRLDHAPKLALADRDHMFQAISS
jgi:hypothetical protein